MNKKNIPIVVQLKQNNNYIVQGIVQYDAGVLFDIKIMDGLEAFNYAGASVVTLRITKPDETITYDSNGSDNVDTVDPVNGRLKLNIPTSCTEQTGMHFCTIGFSNEDDTLFATTSFNYYVGANPLADDDDDIIGTNEYPILSNLIAQVANIQNSEVVRQNNEDARKAAEIERENTLDNMNALLAIIQQRLDDTQAALDQLNEALAEGGSIDISTINNLATKAYAQGVAEEESKVSTDTESSLSGLEEGKLGYATDTGKLLLGYDGGTVWLNSPCFVVGSTAPTDTTKLWIDTSNRTLKFYRGSTWVSISAVYA